MRKRSGRLRPLLAGVAALLGASAAVPAQPPKPARVPKALTSVDGKSITLAGRPGVTHLVFVARWCGAPCEQDLAATRELAGAFARQGMRVVVVGVGARETREEFVRWARGAGIGGALVFDADTALEKALGVELVPWHVVVDGAGTVLHSSDGVPDADTVAGWLGGRSGP